MSDTAGHDLSHLSAATARLGHIFARPKVLAGICVVTLACLGWLYLALLSAGATTGSLGRSRLVQVLCGSLQDGFAGPYAAAVVFSMWCAMTLAMMLPSAAPMILTYTEIADTAARKREQIVSPFVLAAGYAVVWFGFSVFAALGQMGLTKAALIDRGMASASPLLSGAIFVFAGIYQFSALKHACLTQCRHPFPVFFTNWATTPAGVFKLGTQARSLLRRLLLGDDAFDVRCRLDEYRLDGRDRHRHDAREDVYGTTFHSCHRCSAYCDRHRYRSGDPGRRLVTANKLK